MEQIKERNKAVLPKKDLPKAPFFLFDMDKVLIENDATPDLLKEQFFSTKTKEATDPKVITVAITLKNLLKQ